ncbi:MAG: fluoride efflux transporter CrcB [Acidimicrobiales bacterium]|nr:fluoride efflux transporter CrcB [Acidimicrobiales bacterium]
MIELLGVAVAGAAGAPARYLLDRAVQHRWSRPFPLGTLAVNVLGSFALGALTGLALYHALATTPRAVLGAGFCGGFTTFSTFAYETAALAQGGANRAAAGNVAVSAVACTAAAALGLALASLG